MPISARKKTPHSNHDPKKQLRLFVNKIPLTPGVYLMKNESGEILYVGKAKSLRKRVLSYFRGRGILPKTVILMERVRDIDYIQTPTEVDALLLEAQLIRKYQPKYNQELKDDKSFPMLKITKELFPRLSITRQKIDRYADYYGPYTDAKLLRQAVDLIHSLFPIRKCQLLPKTACLYYHIGQCLAPCIRPEIKSEYDQLIKEVKDFLGGGKKSFMEYLIERMKKASRELRFEDAQFFKEQIDALSRLQKKKVIGRSLGQGVGLSATLELKRALRMDRIPARVVCFDVSNIQGNEAVASKVSFYRELPDKWGYRRYKIKGVSTINDYAMIAEALTRMLRGIKEGRESFIPDLIMIDGGKGHLNVAQRVLRKEGMDSIELISIAKRFEKVYSTKFSKEIFLPTGSAGLHLLQKVRDEAHRFAITFHRSLKEKLMQRSVLDQIPGIGAKRKKILLEHFDSVQVLKRADRRQLSAIPGINLRVAENVVNFFKEQK